MLSSFATHLPDSSIMELPVVFDEGSMIDYQQAGYWLSSSLSRAHLSFSIARLADRSLFRTSNRFAYKLQCIYTFIQPWHLPYQSCDTSRPGSAPTHTEPQLHWSIMPVESSMNGLRYVNEMCSKRCSCRATRGDKSAFCNWYNANEYRI